MKGKYLYLKFGILGFSLLLLISIIISNFGGSNNYANDNLNEISINEYLAIIDKEETSFVYVGSPSCPHCVQIEPLLIKIVDELDIDINYLNFYEVSKNENDYNRFIESNEILKDDWGTPLLLIFNNGELLDYYMGYTEFEVLKTFYLNHLN